jgi:hypothetical protein
MIFMLFMIYLVPGILILILLRDISTENIFSSLLNMVFFDININSLGRIFINVASLPFYHYCIDL